MFYYHFESLKTTSIRTLVIHQRIITRDVLLSQGEVKALQVKVNFGSGKKDKLEAPKKVLYQSRVSALEDRIRPASDQQQSAWDTMAELNSLVGLTSVKELLNEVYAFAKIQKTRLKQQLIAQPLVLHMIFKGNPGTGKTTVARLVGKLFKEMDILQKGHLIEVERADLVGEYIGHTAQKTREVIRKSIGGILFVDEAYSLARGGEKDFGKEAIDALVKSMEDYKENFIVILAGYREEMNKFLQTNPGLRSRFPIHLEFPDYSVAELMEIAETMVKQRQYYFSEEANEKLLSLLRKNCLFGHEHNGNARMVRNLIERAIRKQAVRLIGKKKLTREDLMLIKEEDIQEINVWPDKKSAGNILHYG